VDIFLCAACHTRLLQFVPDVPEAAAARRRSVEHVFGLTVHWIPVAAACIFAPAHRGDWGTLRQRALVPTKAD
jgi:hypothetical protein